MIDISKGGRADFLSEIKDKKLFCFGGGKIFQRFVKEYPQIIIAGVIDNYISNRNGNVLVDGISISVMSVSEYVEKYAVNSVVVVTVAEFTDVLNELNAREELAGMKCYIALLLLRAYDGQHADIVRRIEKYKYESFDVFAIHNRSDIARFQIGECGEGAMNAGEKAPKDVREIASRLGYYPISFRPFNDTNVKTDSWMLEHNKREWNRCYEMIPDESILLLQHPFRQSQRMRELTLRQLKEKKRVKIISLVHDVEELRKAYYDNYYRNEFKFMLEIADAFIVHNNVMKHFFVEKGIEASKIVELGLFDYLAVDNIDDRPFDGTVVIAGNLDPSKGRFIERLDELTGIRFGLYGANYQGGNANVDYYGAFAVDDIFGALHGNFGLIWNGDRLDACSGEMGNYLRYNNPHKLSLYVATKMPVIVWREAAIAKLVEEEKIGIVVDSLKELPDVLGKMSENEYLEYQAATANLSDKVRTGFFTKRALQAAEQIIGIG